MPRLDTLTLRVRDPEAQRRFYRDILGMTDRGEGRVGYAEGEMAIHFAKAETAYAPRPTDLYWKIAISVPNLDLAVGQLRARGIAVTPPRQFQDVAYLAHVTDPEGFTIELLDHWFEGERPEETHDTTRLGGGPHLGLLTLRTTDIDAVAPELLGWGMRPLSVQNVSTHGFTLYFYAFTNEAPPDPDLAAIENRAWVYQRSYTVLEVQHVHGLDAETHPSKGASGFGGVVLRPPEPKRVSRRLGLSTEMRVAR